MGEPTTRRRLLDLVPEATLRHTPDGSPFVTDEGHHPLDCTLPPGDLEPVATALKATLGVVDHGLFLTHADEVLLGDPDGSVRVLRRSGVKAGWAGTTGPSHLRFESENILVLLLRVADSTQKGCHGGGRTSWPPRQHRLHRPASSTPSEADPSEGPVPIAWRESALTRAKELESLCAWIQANPKGPPGDHTVLANSVNSHLEAVRQAAEAAQLMPKARPRFFRNGALLERALGNLDAAEAELLNFAPASYVLGQMPSLLRHVQCHLIPTDPARKEFERIAQRLGVKDADNPSRTNADRQKLEQIVDDERGKIVTTIRAAGSAKLREQVRVRSFRSVLIVTTVVMMLLAILVALVGFYRPTLIPLCFAPEEAGEAVVVCPTAQSDPFVPTQAPGNTPASGTPPVRDIDNVIRDTATPQDLLVVELVGLIAASVAAAAAIRRVKGSSERYSLPVALAVLKLPTGAITAFLGLLLMRGQFVPGLSALDTSAQILAWALVFGYAQQLFTRLVDQQGQNVLDSVRGADKVQPVPTPP